MNEKVGRGLIIAGMQQSGKTFFTERLAESKNRSGGFTLVYNPGRDEDWKEADILQPVFEYNLPGLAAKKRKELKDNFVAPRVFFHEKSGKYFNAFDVPRIFKGKTVKVYRLGDLTEERKFIKSIYLYIYGALVVFDDFRPVTRYGLKGELTELFSRQNHSGKNYTDTPGIDIAWIYHNLDGPPSELYDYASHLVMFNTATPPRVDSGSEAINQARQYAYEKLLTLPRFSNIQIKIRDVVRPEIRINKFNQ